MEFDRVWGPIILEVARLPQLNVGLFLSCTFASHSFSRSPRVSFVRRLGTRSTDLGPQILAADVRWLYANVRPQQRVPTDLD